MAGDNAAIHIKPAVTANYIVRDWRFELDPTSVFQRFIGDLYSDPYAFVRELIQNALDAMRCRLFEDLRSRGHELPVKPKFQRKFARTTF
jgi:HSP90 family molecular chaperone